MAEQVFLGRAHGIERGDRKVQARVMASVRKKTTDCYGEPSNRDATKSFEEASNNAGNG